MQASEYVWVLPSRPLDLSAENLMLTKAAAEQNAGETEFGAEEP